MEKEKSYYRSDIDGLRALAIIPVVLFHAGFSLFSGGFVGVDVFFVISGFLISSIILRELNNGNFSFLKFFERRVRRILPALLVVTSFTLLFGYKLLLYPGEFNELSKSVFAMSSLLSNVFFLRKIDYFNFTTEQFPLLHTWTLSVEEQFYIVFPILLLITYKYIKNKIVLLFILLAISSFIYSVYLVNIVPGENFSMPFLPKIWGGSINETAGFYLLTTRAWEFLCGVIVTLLSISIKSKQLSELIGFIGLSLLVFAITQFDSRTEFPGLLALIPVTGSLMIIISNNHQTTLVGKILSWRPMLWAGLLSYSLYLWHWPVFVYAKIAFVEISLIGTWLLVVLSFILSYLSYKYVETPFRKSNPKYSSLFVVASGITMLVIFAFIGLSLSYLNVSNVAPAFAQKVFEAREYGVLENNCLINKKADDYLSKGPCYLGTKDSSLPISFVLWGDSHAGTLIDTINSLATKHNVRGAVFVSSACAPIEGVSSSPPKSECETVKKLALEFIKVKNVSTVVLAAKWNTYLGEEPISPQHYLLIDSDSRGVSKSESKIVFEKRLRMMLNNMSENKRNVFILKQVPRYDKYNPRKTFYDSIAIGHIPKLPTISLSKHLANNQTSDEIIDKMDSIKDIMIINPSETFCQQETCYLEMDNTILYRDISHLNTAGVQILEKKLEYIF